MTTEAVVSTTAVPRTQSCSSSNLLLTGLEEGRAFQRTAAVVDLDDITVGAQFAGTTHGDVLFAGILGEAPFQTLEDLLAAGKLEFSATNGFNDVRLAGILGTDAQQDLSDVDASGNANGLSVGVTHSRRQSIGAGTGKHLVGAEHVEGMGADANVEGVLSDVLTQVLVDGDAACFQGFAGDLLLFVADQVSDKGELIDGGLLGTDVKNLDLGFGHTTAVPRLDVRLVLLVTVATSWTTTHGDGSF